MEVKGQFKVGQKVQYSKEIMFKGVENVCSVIVAIGRTTLLLENGDEIRVY